MAQHLSYLIIRNTPSSIFIKHFKCLLQLLIGQNHPLRYGSHNELGVIYLSRSIKVYLLEHLIDILIAEIPAKILLPAILNLFLGQLRIPILVHEPEHFVNILPLLFRYALRCYEGICGLHQPRPSIELLHIDQRQLSCVLINLLHLLILLPDPRVLQSLRRRGALFRVRGQQGLDEFLRIH